MPTDSLTKLRAERDELRLRLEEAEQALDAIRTGQVDSLVVDGPDGLRIFSLDSAIHSYRVLVEAMSEGAATLTDGGAIVYCNGRLAAMLDVPLERVMGTALRDWLPQRSQPSLDAMLQRASAGEVREELALARRDGEVPVYVSISAIHDDGERVFCVVLTDLREQKRQAALRTSEERARITAESLREADRRKNEFLAVLSHELRNPLAPIHNSLYILDRAAPGGEQARRVQAILRRQVGQLTRLVDDLLDLTRISQNKFELKPVRLDLNDLVRRTVEDYRPIFESSGVLLEVEVAQEPLLVHVDGPRIAQVIGNLLQNAAKFTARGGSARVSVARDSLRAVVVVADTGVGMPPGLVHRVFEPFIQADSTLERSKGGLGLGLALVKSIVEMHGGEVFARSEGLGRGAEFGVRLPLAGVERAAPPAPARSAARPRRILLVEDNVDAAGSLAEALELGGHVVAVAHDGAEAIAKARQFRPDVVLCDIGLPSMDGYALARALRQDESLRGALLVALTGYALPEDIERATRAGFDRHLAKPASPEEIGDLLSSSPPGAAPSRETA